MIVSTTADPFPFAAIIASRSEQSALQAPSAVSFPFVTSNEDAGVGLGVGVGEGVGVAVAVGVGVAVAVGVGVEVDVGVGV
jgi:hypothetical protein